MHACRVVRERVCVCTSALPAGQVIVGVGLARHVNSRVRPVYHMPAVIGILRGSRSQVPATVKVQRVNSHRAV